MRARRLLLGLALLALPTAGGAAQGVDPGARWRTLRTAHFDVHFDAALDTVARRAAAAAERAYAALARELVRPRGRIDLVVSDDADHANGFALVAPVPRIVVYATPPLDDPSLRFYDDWIELVVAHELVHIFHLDRSRGWWAAAQRVFGRNPWLFPASYAPAWVSEGLATWYESRLTSAGRVRGTHERMVVEAAALAGDFPGPREISLASTRYPGGEMAYAYGALFIDWLAGTRGAERVPRWIERAAREPIPFRLAPAARAAFGTNIDRAWRAWRDSLERATGARAGAPLPGWRDLTREGRTAWYPRWLGDSAILYAAAPGKEVPGLYAVDLAGRARRLGRANGVEAAAPRGDGAVVFAQPELADPYRVRSDLWLLRDGAARRLTSGARLLAPDARADGWIVAVRLAPGTNQLVRVSPDGRLVLPLTRVSLDTQWAEPRWSPRGDLIAATRWTRGGFADIVVVDTLGATVARLTHDRAVDSSPSWLPDGSGVLFTSDRGGVADVHLARLDGGGARRLSRAAAGLFYPAASPDGASLAAARFAADGWHVGVAPLDTAPSEPAASAADGAHAPVPDASLAPGEARPYSPWRGLIPRAWSPVVAENAAGRAALGAETSASDAVGRHAWAARALLDPDGEDHEWSASWRWRGLRQPVLEVGAWQEWSRFGVVDTAGEPVGALRRRARVASLALSVARPRMRSAASLSIGGEVETRRYLTDPAPLLDALDPFYRGEPEYRALVAGAAWSNLRRPALAISAEDGVALSATARWRWRRGEGGLESRSITAVASAFRGLDLGGFAHHVVAARVAAGVADGRAPGELSVGGTSGAPATVLPGVVLGQRRTFGVRGFPPGARAGRRALAASLEYRAPLARLGRGVPVLPVFLDRASLSLFGDAGMADDRDAGDATASDAWLASAGAELALDAALQYDLATRLRLGVALPVVDHSRLPVRPASVYVRLGAAF